MRRLILWTLALGLAASASAITPSTGNVYRPEQKPVGGEYQNPAERVHGDTVADPFIISPLPYTASGTTCGFANDYEYACPYAGSTAPDVVYRFVPATSPAVTINLCASTYDTKVYVYDSNMNVIACNDDYCSFQSLLSNVSVTVGSTYFIIVDGYGSSCGNYVLTVTNMVGPHLGCPDGAMLEGEPNCYDGYNDTYNGGCNSTLPVFQVLSPTGTDITICGTTGVFTFGSGLYRDTDWFQMDVTQTSYICLSGDALVPCYYLIIDGRGGCESDVVVAYGVAGPLSPVSDICYTCDPGIWWAWAGPTDWDTSFVCGTLYIMTISGYVDSTPAAFTTWGRVKGLFR